MNLNLEGKTIVITGGSSGIGMATAEFFVTQKAKVYSLDIQKSKSTSSYIEHVDCDVSSYSEVQRAFKKVISKTNILDYVFANAGQYLYGNLENTSESDMDRIININLKGTCYTIQAALPVMKQQRF